MKSTRLFGKICKQTNNEHLKAIIGKYGWTRQNTKEEGLVQFSKDNINTV